MIAAREGNDVSHAVLERGQGGGGGRSRGEVDGQSQDLFLSRCKSKEQRKTRQNLGNTLLAC